MLGVSSGVCGISQYAESSAIGVGDPFYGLDDQRKSRSGTAFVFCFCEGFRLIVFFYAGVQKVLLGTYFSGQYLAYKTYMAPRFRSFAFLWCSTEEFNALISLRWPPHAGLGGFKLKTWYGLLVSNATWVLEVLLPFLVLFARWRSFWVLVTIVFVGLFQLAALELEFFLVMAILLALFFERPYEKALFGCSVVLLVLNVVVLGDY